MKNTFLVLCAIAMISSCKNETSTSTDSETAASEKTTELSTSQRLAKIAGLESWNEVEEIKFSFNVGKTGKTVLTRNWTWNPNTNDVQLIALGDTISYNRDSKLDSLQISSDRAFINDVYWLIPEFKLVWDQGTTITEKKSQTAPISKDTMDMISILYNNKAGYTPGDAYDIYYNDDHKFKEWVYRRGNDSTPSMITTFEKFKTIEGLTFATDHRSSDGTTSINFTGIAITKTK
jgi:hypothetical protein